MRSSYAIKQTNLQCYGQVPSLNCGVLKVKEHSSTSAVISHWVQRSDDQKMS